MEISDAKDVMWLGLALLFVVAGFGMAYALWRTGRALRAAERELHRTVDEFVPLMARAGVGMDTVNSQLEKVDVMLDSAVDVTDSLDTSVRAVSLAVSEPVKKASGLFAGASEAMASFRERLAADFGSNGAAARGAAIGEGGAAIGEGAVVDAAIAATGADDAGEVTVAATATTTVVEVDASPSGSVTPPRIAGTDEEVEGRT